MYKKVVFMAAVVTASIVSVQKSDGQQIGNGVLGIRAGVNLTKLTGDLDDEMSAKFKPGIQLGVVANFPMKNEKLTLQPGIIFSQQGAKWSDSESVTYAGIKFESETFTKMTLNYLQIPVNFLYRHELNGGNILMLQAGPYLGYGISGKVKEEVTVSRGGETETERETETIKFGGDKKKHDFKTFDLGLGIGVGMLFSETFHVSLGYNLGLADIGHYVSVKNTGFALTLTYMLGQ